MGIFGLLCTASTLRFKFREKGSNMDVVPFNDPSQYLRDNQDNTNDDIESVEEEELESDEGNMNKSNDLSAHAGERFLGIMKDNSLGKSPVSLNK